MGKQYLAAGFALTAFLIALLAFGQTPTPTQTPMPTPVLVSTATPTPSVSPNDAGTVSVPSTLGGTPAEAMPSPSSTPIGVRAAALGESDLGVSEEGAPVFRVDQAVITALAQNPTVLEALQQIRLTKGVIIQISAEALPQIGPSSEWQWTDPKLGSSGGGIVGGGGGGGGGEKAETQAEQRSDIFYRVSITGTQLVFNYSTFRAIRGTFFQRDSAYFALRNTVDTTIATVKTQFYQVIVNRELIVVQEDSVSLLESQLKDQQNRFEAGTVPRFNVLQAQVQLYNQIPQLIAARNNYRISVLTLAKTLGLDFNP